MKPRTVTVERRPYSRSPWRLIDSDTGRELQVDVSMFDHPDLGPMKRPVPGYATKAEAVEALGRAVGRWLDLADQEVRG